MTTFFLLSGDIRGCDFDLLSFVAKCLEMGPATLSGFTAH